jgi:hypothetical protein
VPETRSIGEILRDAEAGDLRKVFAEDRAPYDIVGAADRLFDLLEARGIDYVLVGGMAMLQYIPARNTQDVDLLLDSNTLAMIPELAVSSKDRDFARAEFQGIQVDILLTENKIFDDVRRHHTSQAKFGERQVHAATAQGMLILKLFALPSLYRQGNVVRAAIYEADIAGLLDTHEVKPERALDALAADMLPTDIQALRHTLEEIEKRGQQFQPRTSSPESRSEI